MVLLELLVLAVIWSWIACGVLFLKTTILPRVPLAASPAQWTLPFDAVRFQATDGVELSGWKIPVDPNSPWIILCHGLGTNRADLLDMAAGLAGAGFNLFLFDFRAHGESQGRASSFGWLEQRDLEGALAFLGRQLDVPERPYGVLGVSMGGAVALMVAAQDERLGAVVADSCYADLDGSIRHHLGLLYRLPPVPFGMFAASAYRLRFGAWPHQMAPVKAIAAISPRPVLLIQGTQDPRIPAQEARRLLAAAGQPKELWLIDSSEHLVTFSSDPAAYLAKLTAFFTANLR